jgi:predicted CXXCH cytochrome family protein
MSLAKAVPALCADCHDTQPAAVRPLHKGFPVDEADCASCHAPHASDGRGLPHAVSHGPYASGDCAGCHVGSTPKLVSPQRTLCLDCHPGLAEDLKMGVEHAPLLEDDSCTACHSPHTAPHTALLPRSEAQVCGSCHEMNAEQIRTAEHVHPAVGTSTCTVCHDPHLAAPDRNAPDEKPEVCLNCHSYTQHTDHPMGADSIDPRTGGPMRCGSCHDPHGTAWPKFMQDDPSGRICVDCHSDKLRQKRSP